MSNPPHVLVLPYPAQGHVMPLMELAQTLAGHGFNITFVNTEITHQLVASTLPEEDGLGRRIRLVSVSDGLDEAGVDRKLWDKSLEAIPVFMAAKLEKLIREIQEVEGERIACFVSDYILDWAIEIGRKMGIKAAAFAPAAVACLVLGSNISKMIDDGVIDQDGNPLKNQTTQFSPAMPAINTEDFPWARFPSATYRKIVFELMKTNNVGAKKAEWILCNSTYDLEAGALGLVPEARPVGPLLASNRLGRSVGHFWRPEDSACLEWLDQQPPNSVIYVAFGSSTVFSLAQFLDLALGLELTNRPFLWAIRPGITPGSEPDYPDGLLDRVGSRGKMVSWAPQQKVLSHPSVACFFSHCGWNSTMEGVSNGVPFLCWPYGGDQFINQNYICDVWKVGLGFEREKNGIITKEDVKDKVELLFGDESFRARALELKGASMASLGENGSSYKNLHDFMEWVRA